MIINNFKVKNKISGLLIIILILFSLLSITTLSSVSGSSEPNYNQTRAVTTGEWTGTKIWADNEQLKTVAIGDIDPTHDGNELVVGGDSQRITMLKGGEYYWQSKMIWYDEWYTNSIDIGDIDPAHDGDEVVTVGWSGQVTMIYWENDSWKTYVIAQMPDYLYDVKIADIDPSTSTKEVMVVGDDSDLTLFNRNGTDDSWTRTKLFHDTDYLHLITVGEFYSQNNGIEILVSGGSSRLTMIYLENETTVTSTIYTDPRLINSAQIGEFYSYNSGNEVVAVTTGDKVIMIYHNGTGWTNETIFEDTNDLYNVKIGDIDPVQEGNEIITGGISNRLIILNEPDPNSSEWDITILPNPGEQNVYLLANAVGDFDPTHEGDEIATVGYLGKVIKTQFETRDFSFVPVQDTQIVHAGDSVDFELILTSQGGFNENVQLKVTENPSPTKFQASLDHATLSPPNLANLKIDIDGTIAPDTYIFKLNGSNPDGSIYHQLEITLIVKPSDTSNFEIIARPKSQSVIADFSTEYIIDLISINDLNVPLDLSISRLPTGVNAKFNYTTITPTGSVNLTIQTSTITSNRTYYIPVSATSQVPVSGNSKLEHSIVLILIVGATGQQDFILETSPYHKTVFINQSVEYNIEVISLFGFKSAVNLDVYNIPTGVTASFEDNTVIPTANVSLTFFIDENAAEGNYDLEIVGYYTTLDHSSFIKLTIAREPPDYTFTVNPRHVSINEPMTMEFDVRIYPNNELHESLTLTLSGLPSDVSWNQDVTPIYVDSITGIGVLVKTKGETEHGIYNITFTFTSDSGIEHNNTITLELTEDYGKTGDPESFLPLVIIEIMIVIIILIVIILIFVKRKKSVK